MRKLGASRKLTTQIDHLYHSKNLEESLKAKFATFIVKKSSSVIYRNSCTFCGMSTTQGCCRKIGLDKQNVTNVIREALGLHYYEICDIN